MVLAVEDHDRRASRGSPGFPAFLSGNGCSGRRRGDGDRPTRVGVHAVERRNPQRFALLPVPGRLVAMMKTTGKATMKRSKAFLKGLSILHRRQMHELMAATHNSPTAGPTSSRFNSQSSTLLLTRRCCSVHISTPSWVRLLLSV
jgi:hypothetical protein